MRRPAPMTGPRRSRCAAPFSVPGKPAMRGVRGHPGPGPRAARRSPPGRTRRNAAGRGSSGRARSRRHRSARPGSTCLWCPGGEHLAQRGRDHPAALHRRGLARGLELGGRDAGERTAIGAAGFKAISTVSPGAMASVSKRHPSGRRSGRAPMQARLARWMRSQELANAARGAAARPSSCRWPRTGPRHRGGDGCAVGLAERHRRALPADTVADLTKLAQQAGLAARPSEPRAGNDTR